MPPGVSAKGCENMLQGARISAQHLMRSRAGGLCFLLTPAGCENAVKNGRDELGYWFYWILIRSRDKGFFCGVGAYK